MPKRAPRLRLSWIPTWSVQSQATSPARRFGEEKHQALVPRSAAQPIAPMAMNRRRRLRGTALLFVATADNPSADSAFMLTGEIHFTSFEERERRHYLTRDSLAIVFLAFSTLDANRSIRNRIETGFSNYAVALNAFAEVALADSVESGIDQAEGVSVDFHQSQCELLLEVVAAQFGHV